MIALSGIRIYRSAAMVRLPPSLLMRADTNSPMTKNLGITLIRSPVTTLGNARYANSSAAYTTPYPIEDLYYLSYSLKSIPDKYIPFTREGSANVLVVQQNNAIIRLMRGSKWRSGFAGKGGRVVILNRSSR